MTQTPTLTAADQTSFDSYGVLMDANKNEPIRAATKAEHDESMASVTGIFRLSLPRDESVAGSWPTGGRRVYVEIV